MNYGIVIKVLGNLLILEAFMMFPSLFISIYYNEAKIISSFIISMGVTAFFGLVMSKIISNSNKIKSREGLAIVAFGWIVVSIFGSLPFILSGSIPSVVDAVFETISGFTTTGATIIENIELIPKGIVFWRSFIHWIGGMGILVFTVAILPTLGVGGFQIYKAEIPGPVADKIVPRIKDTAKILYRTFIIFTIIETLLLMMGGMSFYESIIHAFGTIGTGGCSTNKMSIGAYDSTYIHVVVSLFMMFSGICFSNYYSLSKGKWREVLKDEEIRLYFKIILLSTVLIGINLYFTTDKGFGISLRDSFFQTTSIISTTGYSTVDFDK